MFDKVYQIRTAAASACSHRNTVRASATCRRVEEVLIRGPRRGGPPRHRAASLQGGIAMSTITMSNVAINPSENLPTRPAETSRFERSSLALMSAAVVLALSVVAGLAQQTPPQSEAPAVPPAVVSPAPAPTAPAPAKPSPALASWQQAWSRASIASSAIRRRPVAPKASSRLVSASIVRARS